MQPVHRRAVVKAHLRHAAQRKRHQRQPGNRGNAPQPRLQHRPALRVRRLHQHVDAAKALHAEALLRLLRPRRNQFLHADGVASLQHAPLQRLVQRAVQHSHRLGQHGRNPGGRGRRQPRLAQHPAFHSMQNAEPPLHRPAGEAAAQPRLGHGEILRAVAQQCQPHHLGGLLAGARRAQQHRIARRAGHAHVVDGRAHVAKGRPRLKPRAARVNAHPRPAVLQHRQQQNRVRLAALRPQPQLADVGAQRHRVEIHRQPRDVPLRGKPLRFHVNPGHQFVQGGIAKARGGRFGLSGQSGPQLPPGRALRLPEPGLAGLGCITGHHIHGDALYRERVCGNRFGSLKGCARQQAEKEKSNEPHVDQSQTLFDRNAYLLQLRFRFSSSIW